jgi:hypothetical protein
MRNSSLNIITRRWVRRPFDLVSILWQKFTSYLHRADGLWSPLIVLADEQPVLYRGPSGKGIRVTTSSNVVEFTSTSSSHIHLLLKYNGRSFNSVPHIHLHVYWLVISNDDLRGTCLRANQLHLAPGLGSVEICRARYIPTCRKSYQLSQISTWFRMLVCVCSRTFASPTYFRVCMCVCMCSFTLMPRTYVHVNNFNFFIPNKSLFQLAYMAWRTLSVSCRIHDNVGQGVHKSPWCLGS